MIFCPSAENCNEVFKKILKINLQNGKKSPVWHILINSSPPAHNGEKTLDSKNSIFIQNHFRHGIAALDCNQHFGTLVEGDSWYSDAENDSNQTVKSRRSQFLERYVDYTHQKSLSFFVTNNLGTQKNCGSLLAETFFRNQKISPRKEKNGS